MGMGLINMEPVYRMRLSLFVSAFLCLLPLAGSAHAQLIEGVDRSRFGAGGYYRYAEEGELTISVAAYGGVRYPGYYEVPIGTDANRLLALAGGPQLSLDRRRQDRRIMEVKIFRTDPNQRSELVYEVQMDNAITSVPESVILQDGYVLTVDTMVKQGFLWQDYIPLVSTAVSLGLVVVQILTR